MRSAPLLCLVALLVLGFSGCGATDEQIGETVRTSMQNTLDTDPQFARWNLQVTRVQVVHQTDNLYQGVATIRFRATSHSVPVQVTYDGNNVVWKTDPGAFSFVYK